MEGLAAPLRVAVFGARKALYHRVGLLLTVGVFASSVAGAGPSTQHLLTTFHRSRILAALPHPALPVAALGFTLCLGTFRPAVPNLRYAYHQSDTDNLPVVRANRCIIMTLYAEN